MSVFKLLGQFLRSYRCVGDDLPSGLIRRTRAVFYTLVLVYTLSVIAIFPTLQSSQPVRIQEFIAGESIMRILGLTVVLGPIMEELLFRAGMKRGGKNISRLAGAILFVIIKLLFSSVFAGVQNDLYRSILGYGLYTVCAIASFWILKPRFPKISRAYLRWQPLIFWLLTLAFGLVHLSNFDAVRSKPLVILLVVPQTLLGIMLGFIRIQRGLGRSMVVHMFHNLIQIIPILILKYIGGVAFDPKTLSIDPNLFSGGPKPEFVYMTCFVTLVFIFVSYQLIQELIAFWRTKAK